MLENIKLYNELLKRNSNYRIHVEKIYEYAVNVLPKINRVFANYTGHGIEHSLNVMQYMYELVTDITAISDLEITCMISSALLHDIGMAVNDEEIEYVKNDELVCHGRKYSVIYKKFQNENTALQECIRPVHGERALTHILSMDKSLFLIPEYTNGNFQEELAKICQAHTMDRKWIVENLDNNQVKGKDRLNAQYIAMLLRIGDYLDIDEKRAPMELYRLISPTEFGDKEWKQHYIIENREKIIRDSATHVGRVVIYGQCDNYKIHRKFLNYLAGLSDELLWCTSYSGNHFEERYRLFVQPQIDNRIQTKGFEISDLKLQLDYYAVMKLLMGESIYGNKKFGLRELIQNSVDACKVMMEEADKLEKYQYNPYIPKVQIIIDYNKQKMIVLDNGTGMNYEILTKYFLNIGKSYYQSDEFLYQSKDYHPIGTFGIGFLACFMLSNHVSVETKHYLEKEGFTIELESDSEFVCKKNKVDLIRDSGTAVILNLESVFQVFDENAENIKTFVDRTFLDQGVQVQFIIVDAARKTEELNLKKYEERNQGAIVLDSYLNGISASLELQSDTIKISRKLSELCVESMNEIQEFYEYNSAEHRICSRDLEGKDLGNYINGNQMMVIKIEGVREEEKAEYEEWRKWNTELIFTPKEMQKTIYFPVKYDEALLKYCKDGSHFWNGSGAQWYTVISRFHKIKPSHENKRLESILKECKILTTALYDVELGIFPLIKAGKERYAEFTDAVYLGNGEKENETYWHGIRLENGGFEIDAEIIGVIIGDCVVNITRNDLIPNVARNDLPADEKRKVEEAIKRAMYQYMMDKMTDLELKSAIQLFVDERYPLNNPYYLKK